MSIPPYEITDNDVLFYQHIPKTAGTSLTNIIYEQFPVEAFYQPTSMGDFFKTPPERIEKVRCLTGHLYYNISPVIKRNIIYLTMLRDPVDRTISEFAQIQRAPEHVANSLVKSQSLLDYVKDKRNYFIYANLQTRFIGMDFNFFDILNELAAVKMTAQLVQPFVNYSATKYFDPAILELAQERIEKSAFVGVLEHFDESVELLGATFGWNVPESTTRLNVGSNRPSDIPQEAIDIIKENTQFDAQLYELGKRIFKERYQQRMGDEVIDTAPSVIDLDTASNNVKRVKVLSKQVEKLSKQVETRSKEVELLSGQVGNLQQQLTDYEGRIEALAKENERLTQIEISHAWRITKRIMNLRHKLIPKGSVVENLYLKLRNRLA